MKIKLLAFVFIFWFACSIPNLGLGQSSSQLTYQYELGDKRVSIPTADEPRVEAFGTETLKVAAEYLELGAASWASGRGCVNCHTTGPYLADATAWHSHFGKPNQEVFESFAKEVPNDIQEIRQAEHNGHKYYPGAFSSVWRSLGLAEWDRNVTGKLSETTDRSLREMLTRQSASGAFVSHGEVEIPHITTDFELSLHAARAIVVAPSWLSELEDPNLLARVERLKRWLASAVPKNDFDRVLKLQLGYYLPECVSASEQEAAMELLNRRQHSDGGWSIRDMSPLEDWHFEMSPKVLSLIRSLPDAGNPQSDPYMTALAIVLMRQSNVPVSDPRIERGLSWLKREQRQSGRWWMHSLYRGNYHYTTYIATVEAMKALKLCGELDRITAIETP
ncbi:MAG: hypothetical protein ACK5E3_16070 [Planctomycetota bacterium]|jgi:squalene-hopene/tetraprenyl-beta-curcumene cyclase